MRERRELHEKLFVLLQEVDVPYAGEALLDSSGDALIDSDYGVIEARVPEDGHLYFQPPPTVRMKYPAIVYALAQLPVWRADNVVYHSRKRYTVTAIDKDPDSRLPEVLAEFPMCTMNRSFTADNLNHWVFDLYF